MLHLYGDQKTTCRSQLLPPYTHIIPYDKSHTHTQEYHMHACTHTLLASFLWRILIHTSKTLLKKKKK